MFAKSEWTQLQFFFDYIEGDNRYPNKVKMSYRKYAAQQAFEVIPNPEHPTGTIDSSLCDMITNYIAINLGLGVRHIQIFNYPNAEDDEPSFILKSLPSDLPLKPQGFIEKSHETLIEVLHSVDKYFSGYEPNVAEEWRKWGKRNCSIVRIPPSSR